MPHRRNYVSQHDWKDLQMAPRLRSVQQPDINVVLQPQVDLDVPVNTVLVHAGATLDLKNVDHLDIVEVLCAFS